MCVRVDMVTLTYKDEGEAYGVSNARHAKALFPEDYRKWIRRLKKRGHRVRYLVTGEYGKEKGRAHWHVLLFWYSQPWAALLSTQAVTRHWYDKGSKHNKRGYPEQDHWMHGHCIVEVVDSWKAISYVTKYITKDQTGDTETYFAASHNIGTAWICGQWAQTCVNQGLIPPSFKAFTRYEFQEDRDTDKTGKAWQYRMHPVVAAKFAKALVDKWDAQRTDIPPKSPALFHFLAKWDKLFYREVDKVPFRPDPYRDTLRVPKPEDLPKGLWHDVAIRFSDTHNAHYFDDPDTNQRYWYGPSTIDPGEWDWLVKINHRERVERQNVLDALEAHGATQSRPQGEDRLL